MMLTGGPSKVNTKMEVVNSNDDKIQGLYAEGVDIGGADEDTYSGTGPRRYSYVWTILSGCIAAENSAGVTLKKT